MPTQKAIRQWGLSISGVALATACAASAQAQDDGAATSGEQRASANEIIVTAQFREQSVQDTPIAISAMNSETLAQKGVADIVGAANIAPNVQLSSAAGNFGGMAAVFIRGVGQSDPHFAVEPGVGMYVDDVYFGVLSGSVFELLDVDRVEVLRGPQGTLAGKNSIGGSVKLFSKRPGPDADAFVEAGYGSRNTIVARGATSFTVADGVLYGRISAGAKYADGYVDRLDYGCVTGDFSSGSQRVSADNCKIGEQGGKEVYAMRASLLFTPSDNIENLTVFDITRDRSQNPATKTLTQWAPWAGTNNYLTGPKSYTNYEDYQSLPTGGLAAGTAFTMPAITPVDAWGISNNLTIDLSDSLQLTSITAFRTSDVTFSSTIEASPASINDQVWNLDHEQFTQELRLSGEIPALLDWTLGGYLYDASGVSGGRVNIPGGLAPGGGGINLDILFRDPVKTKSKSVFAHTVWHLGDRLNITAAVRYTDDTKKFTFNRYDIDGSPHPLLGALVNLPVTYKGDRWDYRLGLDYEWADGLMTYAQVSTGYKGGGVNPRPFFATQALPYQPEELTAYEAGFKSSFLDGRATLNGAVFFNDYTNFQASLLSCDDISPFPGAPCNQTTNVGDAEITGGELELFLEPVDGLTLDAAMGYIDFKYTDVDPGTGIDASMKNVYSPEWTLSGGIQFEIPFESGASLTPRMDVSYRSRVEGDAVNNDLSSIPGRALLGAKLTYRSADEDWEAQLSASNLTDKFYYDAVRTLPNPPYVAGLSVLGAPRTFLFTIKRMFD